MTRAARAIALPLLLVTLLTGAAGSTDAHVTGADAAAGSRARGDTAGAIGFDISYPQCGGPFPKDGDFRIVGVNGGRAFHANPCLGTGNGPSELAWAGMRAELYANTGNPGPRLSSRWPIGQTYPRQCTEADPDSAACAFDYGWNAARDSYRTAIRAYISLGWAQPGARRTPVANRWWLDVETANSWRSDTFINVAALRGAVRYLESVGAASVGFYSAPHMWREITGNTEAFTDYPTWVAGATTRAGARRRCAGDGFTGGGVELAQFFINGFDADYRC
jgi:hypothetical protein